MESHLASLVVDRGFVDVDLSVVNFKELFVCHLIDVLEIDDILDEVSVCQRDSSENAKLIEHHQPCIYCLVVGMAAREFRHSTCESNSVGKVNVDACWQAFWVVLVEGVSSVNNIDLAH